MLLATVLAGPAATPASAQRLERLFYYVTREDAWASLQAHADQVSIVAPEGFHVDEHGVVWGEVDPRVIELGKQKNIPVMPLIQNPGFDQALLHALLSSDDARARTVASLVELCRRNGFAGIQFDFENVSIEDRDAYTGFYRETSDALHTAGFRISMAVVHRPDELAGPSRYHAWLFENWRAGYDIDAIGRIGDFISVMTYSQHTRRTPPGPQASIPWDEDVVRYFLEHVPAQKLSLGIPVGGQHWYTSQEDRITPELARSYSRGLPYAEIMGLIQRNHAELRWDDHAQVPYASFSRGGTWEWVFFENARSFAAKLDLARRHGLRGISVWVIGSEDPAILVSLTSTRRLTTRARRTVSCTAELEAQRVRRGGALPLTSIAFFLPFLRRSR